MKKDLLQFIGGIVWFIVVIGAYFYWPNIQHWFQSSSTTTATTPSFQIVDVKTGWTERFGSIVPVVSFKIKNTSNNPISGLFVSVSFEDPSTKYQFGTDLEIPVTASSPLPPGYTGGYEEYKSDNGIPTPINLPSLQAVIRWRDGQHSNFQYLTTIPVSTSPWPQ